ncbi:MAG TPA: serine hydrolase [Terriglobia bacterium]|nr:serine hydrolase [Terriglobia bacterium]
MRKFLSCVLFLSLTVWTFAGPLTSLRTVASDKLTAITHKSPVLNPLSNSAALAITPAASAADPLEGFDQFVAQVMKDWKVPGVAVAIVKDGKLILAKGYGERDTHQHLPVTPQTLFAIGSISKSFTVTAMGMLVDEGKLDWDKPVRNYIPEFKMFDAVASEHMTPRDLITHRSGLPRHDMVWYSSNFSRADMVRRLRYLEPNKDFRSTYQYNNLMFVTAGYLVGRVAGTTWEEFVRRRILGPLGMKNTNYSVDVSQKSADFAMPYQNADGVVKDMPFHNVDQIAPAGSINSNVDEMAQYLLFHLSKGMHGQTRLLSENSENQMQSPQMVEPSSERWKEIGLSTYGMALGVSDYRGHKFVSHGGAIDGFTAQLSFMPQDNIGAIVLANLDSNKDPLPIIVTYAIYDRLLGLEPTPWNQRFLDDEQKSKQSEEEAKKEGFTERKPNTHPSHDLKDYVGKYMNPGYGIVKIEPDGEGFKFSLNLLTSQLRHFHYDVFWVPPNPLDQMEKTKVQFFSDMNGDISSLSIPLEPHVKDIVFNRLPEQDMTTKNFLEPLTGQYQLGGATETVTLEGDQALFLIVPGQAKYELIPRRGTTFDIKGLSGYSIEFRKNAVGKVTEAVFYQPDGAYVAKKK